MAHGNVLTHYQTTNLRLFQTERVCRRQFDENCRKLSKQVENTVGKGEIARYEQFLLFPQCFQKVCFPGASKGVIVYGNGLSRLLISWSSFTHISTFVYLSCVAANHFLNSFANKS